MSHICYLVFFASFLLSLSPLVDIHRSTERQ